MARIAKNPEQQDWSLLGLRVLLLAVGIGYVYISGITTSFQPGGGLFEVLLVGAISNLVVLAITFVPALRQGLIPAIILGDWLTVFFFLNLPLADPTLIAIAVISVVLISSVRLDFIAGAIQSAGLVAVTFYMLTPGVNPTLASGAAASPLMAVLILSVINSTRTLARDYDMMRERDALKTLRQKTEKQVDDIRERTKAVYEMSATLSATLDFEKVLAAALDAGRLCMRERDGKHVMGMVLLYQGNGELRVASGRRLPRSDEQRVIPGKQGILGEALSECVPVIGKDARRDPEMQYFVGFQQSRSVLCIPLRAGYTNFGVLVYGSDKPDAFTSEYMDLLNAIGTQATMALQNALLYRNLANEKERIVDVEEDARKKLARDLHDGPTQDISAIAMRMSYIHRLLERTPEEVPEELKKVEELARKTTKVIRDMLFTLRPLVLESQGLAAALDQLAQKIQETHGQAVAPHVTADAEKALTSNQQGVIFYIVEEAVNNARKHAQAELISVNIRRRQDVVVVEIADNGVGFDTSAVTANYDQRGSLGMVNMQERTELLDGTLHIESTEGRGTTITILVPIASADPSTSRPRRPRSNKIGAAAASSARLH